VPTAHIDAILKRFGGELVDYGSGVWGGRSEADEFQPLDEREL